MGMAVLMILAIVIPSLSQEMQLGIREVKDISSPIGATYCRAVIRVTDGTNPIPFATVVLDGTLTTITDQNGRVFFDVVRGWHTVNASKFDPINNTCYINGSRRFECCYCGNRIYPVVTLQRCACPPARITVTKEVIGNGPKSVSDFPLFVSGESVESGVTYEFPAGEYTINETEDANYTAEISGDCAPDGSITMISGQVYYCNISNTYIPPPVGMLTVTKIVRGGSKNVSDFQLFVNNKSVESGVTYEFPAGNYTISETTHPNYTARIYGDCDANGNITIAIGQSYNCTIINTYESPQEVPTLSSIGIAGLAVFLGLIGVRHLKRRR